MSGKAALHQSRPATHADQLFCNVRQEATVMGASPSSWGCQWSWTQHSNTSTPTCRLATQLLPPCSVQQASVPLTRAAAYFNPCIQQQPQPQASVH